MKEIQTDISARYLPLITIFFEANELFKLGFKLGSAEINNPLTYTVSPFTGSAKTYSIPATKAVVQYTYDDDDDEQVSKLMFMAIKHLGFTNMLHDYLNKCGYSNHTQ